jgi:hypothetical protein
MIVSIIIVLAVLVLALLLFPVTISFDSVRSGGKTDGSLRVSWIIFLFRYSLKEKQLEIFIFGRSIISRISPEKKPPVKERNLKKPGRMPPIIDFLNLTGPLLRLFKDMVHAFRLKYFDVDIAFGLGDPACTGILTGLMHAVRGSFGMGQNIRFAPDFTGKVLDWKLKANASITPFRIIVPFVKFATSRQVLRLALKSI